jgi:hypothetical protein
MSYTLGGKPLDTKTPEAKPTNTSTTKDSQSDRAEEKTIVDQIAQGSAHGNDVSYGQGAPAIDPNFKQRVADASGFNKKPDAKKSDTDKKPSSDVTAAIAAISEVYGSHHGVGKRMPCPVCKTGAHCPCPGRDRRKKIPITGQKDKKPKTIKEVKQKQKTSFPPGLVVSEKAKEKMAKHQAKMEEKRQEKEAKKQEQESRWQTRPKIIEKWMKWEEKQQAVKDKILAKWEKQDEKRALKRSLIEEKHADDPEALKKAKDKHANEDTKDRLYRAEYMARVEEKQLRALKKREHSQVRNDKVFNFFAGFIGWDKREIPNIPASTLKDWTLEGFGDPEADSGGLSLGIILAIAAGLYFLTRKKTPALPTPTTPAIPARRRKRRRK